MASYDPNTGELIDDLQSALHPNQIATAAQLERLAAEYRRLGITTTPSEAQLQSRAWVSDELTRCFAEGRPIPADNPVAAFQAARSRVAA